jgi:hypothetical protein
MSEPSSRAGFWHGAFAGFSGVVVLIQLTFALDHSQLAQMYRDFGDVTLSLLTRITIHPAWLWGTPLVGGAAVTGLLVKRPRSLAAYIVVAVAVVVAAAASYYYPRAPMFALAGNIRAD